MSDATSEPAPAPVATGEVSKDDKTMGMLSHLLAIFIGFLGPLIIYLVKGKESEFISDQSKEALNFQITVFIALVACGVLSLVLIGFFLIPVVLLGNLILTIMAAIKANDGVKYRYPFAIRLIK
jgi:uncharacterized protein